MSFTSTLAVALISLILLGIVGSAVYSAASDCADRINQRNNAITIELSGYNN